MAAPLGAGGVGGTTAAVPVAAALAVEGVAVGYAPPVRAEVEAMLVA